MYGGQFGEFVCGYWGLKGYESLLAEANKLAIYKWQQVVEFWTKKNKSSQQLGW